MPRLIRALAGTALALGGLAATLPAQSAPVEGHRSVRVNGVERAYLTYIPSSYRRGQPAPLIFVFHGGGGRAGTIAPHTGFDRVAEREGFLVVYPDGLDRRWNDGRGYAATSDDVGFVRALLVSLQRELSVDPRRV